MFRQQHINLDAAVRRFLQNVDSLTRLPLISDADYLLLLGPGVVEASAVMSRINGAKNLCADCPKRCCPLVKCELYDTRFSRCPIFEYRPLVCRMHYCDRFVQEDRSFIGEFADVYLNALIEAKVHGSRKVDLVDSPPFSRYAHELLEALRPALEAFREGRLEEKVALEAMRAEAERFRTPPSFAERIKETPEAAAAWEEVKKEFPNP
jgi:hypothetical protein